MLGWLTSRATVIGDPFMGIVQGSRARKDDAALRLRLYSDDQAEQTFRLIAQRWSEPETFRVFTQNIVKLIVDKRATAYRVPPRRTFQGWDQEAGDALYQTIRADLVLKRASKLTKLLKTTALQVGWEGDRATLAIVTPNILDAEWTDPERPTRLVVTHVGRREQDTTYSDWTAATYTRRDYRGRPLSLSANPNGVNPYSALPFVPLFDRLPDDEFFLSGGADLIEAQQAVNVALANLWRAVEMQAHGQAWATGITPGDILKVGPNRTIALPQGGQFGFAAPNAPIEDILSAIQFVMRTTAITNGVSADVLDESKTAESGSAKHAERQDLREVRQDDIALWRAYEVRLFETLKRVVNTHAPGTIPADATVTVDFAEEDYLSESEVLSNARIKVELGVWSPVDVLMASNPDGFPTREAAFIELARRRDEARDLQLPL